MGEEQRVPCVTPAAGMTHTHTCSQGGAETAGLGSSQQGPEGLHLKATKSNRAGGGHRGSSRDKKHREGVPGQGAELRKRCPKKGNTTTSWRCAPRFLFPPGRTWRRQAQPDASSLEMATNRNRDGRTCKAAEPHVCPTSGQPLRQAFPSR